MSTVSEIDLAQAAMRATGMMLHESQRVGFLMGAAPPGDSFRIDELIAVVIVQANIAGLMRDTEQSHAYATYEQTPPDDLRRPVSIRSISNSLRLPFETTRRRVAGLVEKGLCVATNEGVYVPQSVLASPLYRDGCIHMTARLRHLYFELRALGVLPPPRTDVQAAAEPLPYRAFMRRFGEYFLRLTDGMIPIVGGVTQVIVFVGLLQQSAETGRPVSVMRLAEETNLPYETTRRNVGLLVEAGQCRRAKAGFELPPHLFEQPEWAELCRTNLSDVRRFYADLETMGMVGYWIGESEAG